LPMGEDRGEEGMSKSKIEWTDAVWNPVTGCSKVSEGCRNCYAERLWPRLKAMGNPAYKDRNFNDVACHQERLEQPLGWRKPRRIFVNSMSDLFHDDVPFEFIGHVFAKMHNYRQHTFMILTKRPERMKEFIEWYKTEWLAGFESAWPREYTHVWLGVSVENQAAADERIPLLLQTPAAVRFISAEPLLGQVRLDELSRPDKYEPGALYYDDALTGFNATRAGGWYGNKLDWVIVGGESGPGARPMHPDWVRGLRDQCQAAGTKFFFKQHGEFIQVGECMNETDDVKFYNAPNTRRVNHNGGMGFHGAGAIYMQRVGKKKAGRELDGQTWDEMPAIGGQRDG